MPTTASQLPPLARLASPSARGVTRRSVLLGSLAVAGICSLTPFNDFVLSDTSLAAGFLPLAVVLMMFFLIVLVNAPLHRWAPHFALTTRELAVVLLMALVASALPNWGLMRFFIPTPISPFRLGSFDPQFWKAFQAMNLPPWLFPVENMREGPGEDVATWFFTRIPSGESIPFRAWIVPLLCWGIFIAAMLATLTAMARLVIEQWTANERLPFPLVQVQVALIESPPPGRALNDLFRSPWLWIGLGTVFFVHSLSALNAYSPKFPIIPLGYDFTGFISDRAIPGEPLSFMENKVKKAAISFVVLGATYFIRSKAAFSLWGIYILINIFQVQNGMVGGLEIPSAAWQDQHLGACIAFIGGLAWIGRQHWRRIFLNAIGRGESSRYRLSFWIAVGGCVVMVAWLRVVGVHLWMGCLIVLFIVMAHLVVARVLAETGLPWYRSGIGVAQVYTNLPIAAVTRNDIYFASIFTVLGPLTTRDSIAALTTTGLCATRQAEVGESERRGIGGVIAWTLLLGFVIAATTTLYCQYSYPTPISEGSKPARNYFGAEYIPRRDVAPPTKYFEDGKFMPKSHNSWLHMSIGFGITTVLEVLSLRYAGWPLLPVGYVAYYGAFLGNAWFSVFLGWLAKVLIVRFGGTRLYQHLRPLFVGIIFGEALAAGVWLVVNGVVVLGGGEVRAIKIGL